MTNWHRESWTCHITPVGHNKRDNDVPNESITEKKSPVLKFLVYPVTVGISLAVINLLLFGALGIYTDHVVMKKQLADFHESMSTGGRCSMEACQNLEVRTENNERRIWRLENGQ